MALAGFATQISGPLPILQTRRNPPNLPRCSSTNNSSSNGIPPPPMDSLEAMAYRRNLRREYAKKWFQKVAETATDEVDYPMVMDDDGDPNWGEDESGDGWGFRLDKHYAKPKIMKQDGNSDSDSELDNIDWDAETHCEWMVREITQDDWYQVIYEDQRPVMVYVFERYGPSWSVSWDTLKELEKAVKTFYDKKKIGLRVAKVDKWRDRDLVAALKVDSLPALLFISNSKLLHRIYGFRTEDEILQAAAYFYHGARKPDFLEDGLDTLPKLVPEFKPKKKKTAA